MIVTGQLGSKPDPLMITELPCTTVVGLADKLALGL